MSNNINNVSEEEKRDLYEDLLYEIDLALHEAYTQHTAIPVEIQIFMEKESEGHYAAFSYEDLKKIDLIRDARSTLIACGIEEGNKGYKQAERIRKIIDSRLAFNMSYEELKELLDRCSKLYDDSPLYYEETCPEAEYQRKTTGIVVEFDRGQDKTAESEKNPDLGRLK